jgi:erythromycin esterase-like protein
MENNRRSFFKGLAAFASGVAAAKVASYVPKKEEPKEELMVTSTITIKHNNEEYHPLVVKKTDMDGMVFIEPQTPLHINGGAPKIRKANV